MKSKYYLILSLIVLGIISGCKRGDSSSDNVLLPEVKIDEFSDVSVKLSDIFEDYKVVELETTPESLVGGFYRKVVKSGDRYYVRSFNDVVIFDLNGKFLNRLSRVGAGPGEYDQMFYFDVVAEFGEIWVSSMKGIYRYNSDTMEYNGMIPFSFFVCDFKYIGDDKIIVSTNTDDTYRICTMEGKVTASFFPLDPANNRSRTVQFKKIGNILASQLMMTNEAVCYDLSTKEFSIRNIIQPSDKLQSTQINREYLEKYEYLQVISKVNEVYVGIEDFRILGDMVMMEIQYPGRKFALNITKNKESKEYVFFPESESQIINDITPAAGPFFVASFQSGDSNDSFIFLGEREDEENSNPFILEVKQLRIK